MHLLLAPAHFVHRGFVFFYHCHTVVVCLSVSRFFARSERLHMCTVMLDCPRERVWGNEGRKESVYQAGGKPKAGDTRN